MLQSVQNNHGASKFWQISVQRKSTSGNDSVEEREALHVSLSAQQYLRAPSELRRKTTQLFIYLRTCFIRSRLRDQLSTLTVPPLFPPLKLRIPLRFKTEGTAEGRGKLRLRSGHTYALVALLPFALLGM